MWLRHGECMLATRYGSCWVDESVREQHTHAMLENSTRYAGRAVGGSRAKPRTTMLCETRVNPQRGVMNDQGNQVMYACVEDVRERERGEGGGEERVGRRFSMHRKEQEALVTARAHTHHTHARPALRAPRIHALQISAALTPHASQCTRTNSFVLASSWQFRRQREEAQAYAWARSAKKPLPSQHAAVSRLVPSPTLIHLTRYTTATLVLALNPTLTCQSHAKRPRQ